MFHLNRKGDYHRYITEIASDEKRNSATIAAYDAYKVRGCASMIHMYCPLTH
jgi:hypothetical protein